jgi:hypothetical protein
MKKRSTFAPAFENNNSSLAIIKSSVVKGFNKFIFTKMKNKFGNNETTTVFLPTQIRSDEGVLEKSSLI